MKSKSKIHIAFAPEFGFAPDTFALRGETSREGSTPGQADLTRDTTPELFVDREAVENGRKVLQTDLQ